MNIQFAVKNGEVDVLEVNPRASRTVPFVSKAMGLPLAKLAMKAMVGRSLRELGVTQARAVPYVAVKESVFPFKKFTGVDTLLGPEMKSTGEVMGLDRDFGRAFAKAQAAAAGPLPKTGQVFLSVKDKDKSSVFPIALDLARLGFRLVATRGTAEYLRQRGMNVEMVNKVMEGRPHIVDLLKSREVCLVINTVGDKTSQVDSYSIRRTTLNLDIPYSTTVSGARAVARALEAQRSGQWTVKPLQAYHREVS